MRYGISPAEINALESAYKVASRNFEGKELPKLPGLSTEEASEEHEARQAGKRKVYGRMRTRQKPSPF